MRDNGPLKIGLAPIKRGTTRMETALLQKQLILQRMADITPENVALVGIEDVLPEGLLYRHDQVEAVEKAFKRAGVHALFLPHCDFGCEEVVGQLAKRMGVPVLIWGNRDPYPGLPRREGPRHAMRHAGVHQGAAAVWRAVFLYFEYRCGGCAAKARVCGFLRGGQRGAPVLRDAHPAGGHAAAGIFIRDL